MSYELKNIFAEMPFEQLKEMYADYLVWNKTGIIPHPSKLASIAEKYSEESDGFDFIHLMERDFLRECAKRLFEEGTR